ncbi:MAG: hypothetical protein M1840_006552 [Geoglossum simile]|nr:MAG: hypothetical protein M1840_006552 [Geoglossum simile]
MPHAHSGPPHISASPRTTSPTNRPKETPQEKVARLKAAARRAKTGNISTFDRIVVRGRLWADRAHRVVTLSLVGLTAISAVYATVAITDMILYNRRKTREYLAQQSHLLATSTADAVAAESLGTATEEQLSLLKRERDHAVYLAQLGAQAKPGVAERAKGWLFRGLKRDEGEGKEGWSSAGPLSVESNRGGVLAQVQALHAEEETKKPEGMLDQLGSSAPTSSPSPEPSPSSPPKSWTSWLSTGR